MTPELDRYRIGPHRLALEKVLSVCDEADWRTKLELSVLSGKSFGAVSEYIPMLESAGLIEKRRRRILGHPIEVRRILQP